jgi:hypothetical protein
MKRIIDGVKAGSTTVSSELAEENMKRWYKKQKPAKSKKAGPMGSPDVAEEIMKSSYRRLAKKSNTTP